MIEKHPDIALESIGHMVQIISPEKLKEIMKILSDKLNEITVHDKE